MVACVYAIASGKGGTGKTTVTLNLGTALAMSKITLHEVLSGSDRVNEVFEVNKLDLKKYYGRHTPKSA